MALIRFYKPTLRRKDMDAVLQTMVDEKIGPGDRRKLFLRSLCEYLGLKDGIALRSYPDAIGTALSVLNAEPGSTIAVSVLSPEIYRTVITENGLKMMLLDVSPDTGCISADEAKRAESEGAAAILLHEPLSQVPYDLKDLSLSIPLIEDITESFASSFGPFRAGCLGDIVIAAFEEESIVSTGGGAAVLSSKSAYIDSVRKHARRYNPFAELPDLNASLGVVQLLNIDENLKKRRELFRLFSQAAMKSDVKLFGIRSLDFEPSGFHFPIIASGRPDEVVSFAAKYTVPVKRSFTNSCGINYQDRFDLYPNAVISLSRGVSFPLYPFLQPKETEAVIKVLSHLPQ
ncbi:MAG: DegT/DnrJ/EryC1/StrS family aminotransferase [Spirochaetales bacterium]|nr:DegT/DnrJ/EryC1/StrS family aminotransferase [Spirochaetales bacterium]